MQAVNLKPYPFEYSNATSHRSILKFVFIRFLLFFFNIKFNLHYVKTEAKDILCFCDIYLFL